MGLSVGVDLVAVAEVAQSIERFAGDYLTRVYSDAELADCRDAAGAPVAERLAARFAAKEAVIKALRPTGEPIPWREIEIRVGPHGEPDVALRGSAQAAALTRGVRSLAVSLTHEGPFAAAIAVAELGTAPG